MFATMGNVCLEHRGVDDDLCDECWYRKTSASVMSTVDLIGSPEAALTMLQSIIPPDANADLVIDTLSHRVTPKDGDKSLWLVWHQHTVDVGSSCDFAVTNLIVATS